VNAIAPGPFRTNIAGGRMHFEARRRSRRRCRSGASPSPTS
jgi:hypothetical protein